MFKRLALLFGQRPLLWSAVDGGVPGELVMVQVQASRSPSHKPRVLQASHSAHSGWDAAVVNALLKQRRQRSGHTVAVLPRGDYQLMLLPRPPVTAAELERSVRWAIASQVDYPVDDAVVATMALPDSHPPGGTAGPAPGPDDEARSLYAVATQAQVVQQVAQVFEDAGQHLDAIDVRETAQRNIAALLEAADECLCLLRIVRDGIQLTFTHRGELYLDRFVGQPMALLQSSDALDHQHLIERIGQQTQLSIKHIQTHHPGLAVRRVVLCPLPAPLVLDGLAQHIGLPLDPLDLGQLFDLSAVPALSAPAEQARHFVALGAALRSLGATA